jgi:hypothetical protein
MERKCNLKPLQIKGSRNKLEILIIYLGTQIRTIVKDRKFIRSSLYRDSQYGLNRQISREPERVKNR